MSFIGFFRIVIDRIQTIGIIRSSSTRPPNVCKQIATSSERPELFLSWPSPGPKSDAYFYATAISTAFWNTLIARSSV